MYTGTVGGSFDSCGLTLLCIGHRALGAGRPTTKKLWPALESSLVSNLEHQQAPMKVERVDERINDHSDS